MSRYLEPYQVDALYDALDAGMSQRAVAKRLGCSVSTVNDWKKKRESDEYVAPDDALVVAETPRWDCLEDRADAAWRLCQLEDDPEERMLILQAAIWPPKLDNDSGGVYGRDKVHNPDNEVNYGWQAPTDVLDYSEGEFDGSDAV